VSQAANPTITGAGITIGVISDSVNADNSLNQLISNNIITPASRVTVLQDSARTVARGASDEGAAMIQIVAEMCPGCRILFHTSDGGTSAHEQQTRWLWVLRT
jgi:hypothetical protein